MYIFPFSFADAEQEHVVAEQEHVDAKQELADAEQDRTSLMNVPSNVYETICSPNFIMQGEERER